MQSLGRIAPRLLFDSVSLSTGSRSIRISDRPFRPATCRRCRIRIQARRFADTPKSTPPTPPPQSKNLDYAAEETATEASLQPHLSENIASELPSVEDDRRSQVTKRFSHLMDHLQGNIFIASQRINDLTGYSGIEVLKSRITVLEKRVADAQDAVRESRLTYKITVADRASTQREVTTLLARKDSWTPIDLERFTALYRMDHSNEQAVQESATKLSDAEREAEHAASKLSSSILSRYHEEQIWSDKIRRMSTWGTWGLMGVNVLLFLVFQFGFEPWRRRRLVRGFEEKVREALEKEKFVHAEASVRDTADVAPLDGLIAAGIQELEEKSDDITTTTEPVANAVIACIESEPEEPLPLNTEEEASLDAAEMHIPTTIWTKVRNPKTWTAVARDLWSERVIQMRKQDVTIIALEGAATGAAIVAVIATLLRPN